MNYAREVLLKEKEPIMKELSLLIKLHETPYLSMGVKALQRSNMALKRYLDSKEKDKKAYWWAAKWNEFKKYCVEECKKQDFVNYATKRVELELALRDIDSSLWRLGR